MCACTKSCSEGIIDRTGAQTMFYLTCNMIPSVDPANNGISRAKDWVSVDCGTRYIFTCGKSDKVTNRYTNAKDRLTDLE